MSMAQDNDTCLGQGQCYLFWKALDGNLEGQQQNHALLQAAPSMLSWKHTC